MEREAFDHGDEVQALSRKIDGLLIIQQKIIKRIDALLDLMEQQEHIHPPSYGQNETDLPKA